MQSQSPIQQNIQTIRALEEQEIANRTWSARIGDLIATEAGKMWFIVAHLVWFSVWIGINLYGQTDAGFDPYPLSLLTMIVSLDSIFLSLFILMSQNRNGIQADRRNHLDLQINLLAEDENTKIIHMLQALSEHNGLQIGNDPVIKAMADHSSYQRPQQEPARSNLKSLAERSKSSSFTRDQGADQNLRKIAASLLKSATTEIQDHT